MGLLSNILSGKRKTLLIDKTFQMQFLIHSIAVAFSVTAIYYGAICYFFWKFKHEGSAVGLSQSHPFFIFINEQIAWMNMVFFVNTVFVLIVIVISSLIMSNKIAGPLYRLKLTFINYVEKNEITEIKFRKGDYFQEIPMVINAFLKHEKLLRSKD